MKNIIVSNNKNGKKKGNKKNIPFKKPKVLHWIKRQEIIARKRNQRNFDFEIDWNKVEVDDKTLIQIAKNMNLSDDDAFDRALDILELHDDFKIDARWIYREYMKEKFRGNWIHLQWHTFENLQIGIENNRWNRINFSDKTLYLPLDIKQEIYNAEDGRCEKCGQAMHFRTAQFGKRDWTVFNDSKNIKLLCYCCSSNRRNMLLNPNLIISDRNMEYLLARMDFNSIEEVKNYIFENLKYSVHTNTFNPNKQRNRTQVKDQKIRGQYWLPGIGKCRLQYRYGEQGKEFILEFTEFSKNPILKVQPQKRTRNL